MGLLVSLGAAVVGVTAVAVAVPPLIVRRDERAAAAPTGLGDPIPGVRERTVVTDDGAELHLFELGVGPPLLLVHGLALDHRSWHYQFLDLSDRFRIIGVDLRGHGASTSGSAPIGPERFAKDLATVLEELDLRGAVIVGHSLGGTAVGQLCADLPDLVNARVAGLVFVGTFASAITGEGRFRETVSPTLVRAGAKLRTGTTPRSEPSPRALAYAMARTPFGPNPQPEQVRFTLAMGALRAPSLIGAATVGNLAYDVRTRLDAIELPSLIVRGAHDRLSTSRSVAQLEASLKQSEVVVFDDCGHLPMLEDRERFGQVLAGFVTRATGEAR